MEAIEGGNDKRPGTQARGVKTHTDVWDHIPRSSCVGRRLRRAFVREFPTTNGLWLNRYDARLCITPTTRLRPCGGTNQIDRRARRQRARAGRHGRRRGAAPAARLLAAGDADGGGRLADRVRRGASRILALLVARTSRRPPRRRRDPQTRRFGTRRPLLRPRCRRRHQPGVARDQSAQPRTVDEQLLRRHGVAGAGDRTRRPSPRPRPSTRPGGPDPAHARRLGSRGRGRYPLAHHRPVLQRPGERPRGHPGRPYRSRRTRGRDV